MLVVDASVLVPALCDDGVDGRAARARLRGEHLAAPELVDLEVLSVLRRLVAAGVLDEERAGLAVTDLTDLPVTRASHVALAERCWQLRHTVTPYDAAYAALAEAFGCPLLTADARLARAPGLRCDVELLTRPS